MIPKSHRVHIGTLFVSLPIVEIAPGVHIALFNILDDTQLIEHAGLAMVDRCLPPATQRLITVEGKATALAHVVSRESRLPILTLRKGDPKPYARDPVVYDSSVGSMTSRKAVKFWCERADLEHLRGASVSFVDDVSSTGATGEAVRHFVEKVAEGRLASTIVVFHEGEPRPGVIALAGTLPVFRS